MKQILIIVTIGLLTGYYLFQHERQQGDETAPPSQPGFHARHLMAAKDEEFVEENPIPQLDYWFSGDAYPHNIDGGSELIYNWMYYHKVAREYTNMTIVFEVDVPFLTLYKDTVAVYLHSISMEHNYTEIEPLSVEHLEEEEKVRIVVDISEPMWINLTKPWKRPDCWWTPFKDCYKTDYTDCVFIDQSEYQNWNQSSCYKFDVSQCLPFNTTSECHYINTTACLMNLLRETEDASTLHCPVLYNTSCIQVNDRGLYFSLYDWTIPVKPTIAPFIEKEFCNVPTEEIWTSEYNLNGTIYIVEIFLSEDLERNCRSVLMVPGPVPTTPVPTYNPYKELPVTDKYFLARDCLNVNTSGLYETPYAPIEWKDFNVSVSFTGNMSNLMEVNLQFISFLTANLSQPTKSYDQSTSTSASVEYYVKKPYVKLKLFPSFSEPTFVLKHEQVFFEAIITNPEVYNYGVQIVAQVEPVDGAPRMTFLNETPVWDVGANLIASTVNGITHDNDGNLICTPANISLVIQEHREPKVIQDLLASTAEPILDRIVLDIEPFMNIWDNQYNTKDRIRLWFNARVITDVTPDMELPVTVSAQYFHAPNDGLTVKNKKALIVTDQPFIPRILPLHITQHPDTGDNITFTFDLSTTLDHYINDTWMNVSCPDLHTIPNTMELDFLEPMNITTESDYDMAFHTMTTYHIHLTSLFPEVNFYGNETFHLWDNSMVTHQQIVCNMMLSFRKDSAAVVLPYVAGTSPALTMPGISYELYRVGSDRNANETDDVDLYNMPVGSNATYIINITFPELTTKLDVTIALPDGVLAAYYLLIKRQGGQLTMYNESMTSLEVGDEDIALWQMPERTVVNLDFGYIKNIANNIEDINDNLVLEFNVVLRDNPSLVNHDEDYTLETTVMYTNGDDLLQAQDIYVLEPDIVMRVHVTNDTNVGDPGDVFQYYLHLSHTDISQTPAHHILIQLYLPFMNVYQDFIASNISRVPMTSIMPPEEVYSADSILQLYLYKLEMEDVIEGTFLIQISTKLTYGGALLVKTEYEMYSFYQWGRIYQYSNVSENVINIRNATLTFIATSQPQTPDNLVTIHEQVTYRATIPVPPIPTNLTIMVDLPRYETIMKTWKIRELQKAIPKSLPLEQVFYEEGCIANETVTKDACVCYDSLSGNGTFHVMYPDWLPDCFKVLPLNCSRGGQEVFPTVQSNVTTSNKSCILPSNVTQDNNSTNTTICSDSSMSNLTSNKTNFQEDIAVEICQYSSVQYQMCMSSMQVVCQMNANLTALWDYTPDFIICNKTSNGDLNITGNATLNMTGNTTLNMTGNSTQNMTGNSTLNMTGNSTLNMTGNSTLNMTGNSTLNMTGNSTPNMTGNSTLNMTGNSTLNMTGNSTLNMIGNSTLNMTGNSTLMTGNSTLNMTGNSTLNMTGNSTLNMTGNSTLNMTGNSNTTDTATLNMTSVANNVNTTVNSTLNTSSNQSSSFDPVTESPSVGEACVNSSANTTNANGTAGQACMSNKTTATNNASSPGCMPEENLCSSFAQHFCSGASLKICQIGIEDLLQAILNGTVHMREQNSTGNDTSSNGQDEEDQNVDDQNVICACQYLEPPVKLDLSSELNKTAGPYDACANRSDYAPLYTTTPSTATGVNISATSNATEELITSLATAVPTLLMDVDVCEEEEMLLFGMASVVSTSISSSRAGSVCYFNGGNRHDPFNPGVTYIAEHLPANLSDGGALVNVEVTFVILDHPELSRGNVLELNATSVFTYISKPVPPSSIFIENCTCIKPLSEYYQLENDRNCTCETVDMLDVPFEQCSNCTSQYSHEDEGYDYIFTCNCINFCFNNSEYFLNPPPVANLKNFTSDLCDCASLQFSLSKRYPDFALLLHVEQCIESFVYNYTCSNLTYSVTHHELPLSIPCTCQETYNDTLNCLCTEQHMYGHVRDIFGPLVSDIDECTGATDDLVNGLRTFHFESEICSCAVLTQPITTPLPPTPSTQNNISTPTPTRNVTSSLPPTQNNISTPTPNVTSSLPPTPPTQNNISTPTPTRNVTSSLPPTQNNSSTPTPTRNVTSSHLMTNQTTAAPVQPFRNCSCNTICVVHVEQHCDSNKHVRPTRCSHISETEILPLHDSRCECVKRYDVDHSIAEIVSWYQEDGSITTGNDTIWNDTSRNDTLRNEINRNDTYRNDTNSNDSTMQTNVTIGNYTSMQTNASYSNENNTASIQTKDLHSTFSNSYMLDCNCFDIGKLLSHVEPHICQQAIPQETFDCECSVPPDNETQFILDNWDYDEIIVDQMITELSHTTTVIEPDLQITFTREPEPSIVDSIDPVLFHYEISHTELSNAPAYNLTLQLDAINFTITSGISALSTEEHCAESWVCDVTYDNGIGRFHIPLLPVDPPGVIFSGTFNLSVGNYIDFVADSLIAATGIAWYDSCVIDYPGRLYDSIVALDTVKIDAPTISADLDFTTAYAFMFYTTIFGVPPQTFSIGDIVRMKAKLWVPEITLHLANYSIQGLIPNMTVSSGQILLTDQIYHRNDTDSVFVEMEREQVKGGAMYPGQFLNNARFLQDGFTTIPGVIVNTADNIANADDYVSEFFTFQIQNVPYWGQGVEIPWTISAIYYSDYTQELVTLVDETVTLLVVEPQLSLRVEILDHGWQRDQVINEASYTCKDNGCCVDQQCATGKICVTDTANIEDCESLKCLCHSGYSTNELGTCTAVGRTPGDIINFGLTATHHHDYTGNAFDVFIHVTSDLPSDLVTDDHFFSHPGITDYVTSLTQPYLTQLDQHKFELYMKRFNYEDMCNRFVVPQRIRPEVIVYPAQMWSVMASMWYYSAKPYDIVPESNSESRFYVIPSNITFNLTTPAPSARFYMIPPVGGSSAINFNVFSSSNASHAVTVNLREETEVKFVLEVVVPKIKCDFTILVALPIGDGFNFEGVSIVEMGSNIDFPYSKLSNGTLTEDLHGHKYFYADLPGIYSRPNLIDKQRWMNTTIQKRFQTMMGDQQPYPAIPECNILNTTLYEHHLLHGCFHDNQSFFDVAIVTEDHPENYNYSQVMTRKLCHHLCLNADFYISGTKNGTDCYCTNHTGLQSFYDHGSIQHFPMNITYLKPYYVTVYYPCNKTRPVWTNVTYTGHCRDKHLLDACIQECHSVEINKCISTFKLRLNCSSLAMSQCAFSPSNSTGNSSSEISGNWTDFMANNSSSEFSNNSSSELLYNATCWNVTLSECLKIQYSLCQSVSHLVCYDSPEYTTCLESAQETYRLEQQMSCLETSNATCIVNQFLACRRPVKLACQAEAAAACEGLPQMDLQYYTCHTAIFDPCYEPGLVFCDSQSEVYCANMTFSECYVDKVVQQNVTTEQCVTGQLADCSVCLYEQYVNCTKQDVGDTEICSDTAVQNCTLLCKQPNCTWDHLDQMVIYAYDTCTFHESSMEMEWYLGNCSKEEENWKNVTESIMAPRPIPMYFCNVTCSGEEDSTCGSEDFVVIYGPLEGSLVQQQCDWYAGLYNTTEDVFSLEITLSIKALLTKGITEYIQPYVTYNHGEQNLPTLLPFAPFRLEAGTVQLDMNVYVAPKTQGFQPGDWIDYYTELYHNSLSTLTARDIYIVWMFPPYVQFVNITNHKHSLLQYNQLQAATAASTDPKQGFRFTVPTLHNTDMISFHFRILLDSQSTLAQGEYHMVAFAEAYYYTWDLYNPHEDEFKHNVVLHTHNVLPTMISFEVPTTYVGRPELDDLKLSTYNVLYDEVNNIFYACFFNNTVHVYDGGCYMTGNLPSYAVDRPPTCEEFCNCTYFWDLPAHANCSKYEPKPENCSCGCVPDCIEVDTYIRNQSLCKHSCLNCSTCLPSEIVACSADCDTVYWNCTQECCIENCYSPLDSCLQLCTNCSNAWNCTVDRSCTQDCSLLHGHCVFTCIIPPNTCIDNCTDVDEVCLDSCVDTCMESNLVYIPGLSRNCTDICHGECLATSSECTVKCCYGDCAFNHSICHMDCQFSCGDDVNCTTECGAMCNATFEGCVHVCSPQQITCNETCNKDYGICTEYCVVDCIVKSCNTINSTCNEIITHVENFTASNVTALLNNQSMANVSSSPNAVTNCTNTTTECVKSLDDICLATCHTDCNYDLQDCDIKCCYQSCNQLEITCLQNCTYGCVDENCVYDCGFYCLNVLDECNIICNLPDVLCKDICKKEQYLCADICTLCDNEKHVVFNLNTTSNATNQEHTNTTASQDDDMIRNATSCKSNQTTNVNATCTSLNATQVSTTKNPLCTVSFNECLYNCNGTYSSCKSDCPCDETCYLNFDECKDSCIGCRENCFTKCEHNCSLQTHHCEKNCVQAFKTPNLLCTSDCIVYFDECSRDCIHKMYLVARIIDYLDGVCLDECAQETYHCLEPCFRVFTTYNCTDKCESVTLYCTDSCLSQCNGSGIICNASHLNCDSNITCFNSCSENCTGKYSISSTVNMPQLTNTTDAGTSLIIEAFNSTYSTSKIHNSNNVNSNYINNNTTNNYEDDVVCFKSCNSQQLGNLTDCTVTCSSDFTTCLAGCAGCHGADCPMFVCTAACSDSLQNCTLTCLHDATLLNCSNIICAERAADCLGDCQTCNDCRAPCRDECIQDKEDCLEICFPKTCTELHAECMETCSSCDCKDICRQNCSKDHQECSDVCSVTSVNDCQYGFTDCLNMCIITGNGTDETQCMHNCTEQYSNCTTAEIVIPLDMCLCSDINTTTTANNISTNTTSIDTSVQYTAECRSKCLSYFNYSQCQQECSSVPILSLGINETCNFTCLYERFQSFINTQHNCTLGCYNIFWTPICDNIFQSRLAMCDLQCTNCSLCPNCASDCNINLIDCHIAALPPPPTPPVYRDNDSMIINCMMLQDCISNCNISGNSTCSKSDPTSNCSTPLDDCEMVCLHTHISTECNSVFNCTLFESSCKLQKTEPISHVNDFMIVNCTLFKECLSNCNTSNNSTCSIDLDPTSDCSIILDNCMVICLHTYISTKCDTLVNCTQYEPCLSYSRKRRSVTQDLTYVGKAMQHIGNSYTVGIDNTLMWPTASSQVLHTRLPVSFYSSFSLNPGVLVYSHFFSHTEGSIYDDNLKFGQPHALAIIQRHRIKQESNFDGFQDRSRIRRSVSDNFTHIVVNHTESNNTDVKRDLPYCVSNSGFLAFLECEQNCSVLLNTCESVCRNVSCNSAQTTDCCNDTNVAMSQNCTTDTANCSTSTNSVSNCSSLSCIEDCSGNCTNLCNRHRPKQHLQCYEDCNATLSFCLSNCTTCQNTSNCSSLCNTCDLPHHNDILKCQKHCDDIAHFDNCTSSCDDVECPDGWSCECNCTCRESQAVLSNEMCAPFESPNGSVACNLTTDLDVCFCHCGCVEQHFLKWRALHPSVGNLLGLDLADNSLYALSSNGLAIIRSHDYGETWSAVAKDVWTEAQRADAFVDAINLNDEDVLMLEPKERMFFTSGIWNETWGVSGTGVHHRGIRNSPLWKVVGTWSCCSN